VASVLGERDKGEEPPEKEAANIVGTSVSRGCKKRGSIRTCGLRNKDEKAFPFFKKSGGKGGGGGAMHGVSPKKVYLGQSDGEPTAVERRGGVFNGKKANMITMKRFKVTMGAGKEGMK